MGFKSLSSTCRWFLHNFKFSIIPLLLCCFLLPLLTRLLLRLPQLAFTNFTDSIFYLSYSQSFQELFLRHGFIYYASRFGAIFPDAFAFNLFGPTDGPFFFTAFFGMSCFRCAFSSRAALFQPPHWRFCFFALVLPACRRPALVHDLP